MVSAFISYAREDGAFVGHLVRALQQAGQQPRWDQDNRSIAFSAPWRAEIDTAIRESEKFVFVISPDSLRSAACLSELAIARSLQKQVVPVMYRRPPADTDVEAGLRELNWIFFERPDQFPAGIAHLVEVLQTDLAWVRQHSRLAVRAEEWSSAGFDRSRLLRGTDLRDAERWLAEEATHPITPPTPLQRRYVAESRRSADRAARRWRAALAAGLVVAVVLAVFAFIQRNDAQQQATAARARALAAQASADLATNPQASLHLALQSVGVSDSSAGTNVLRLALAADLLRERIRPGGGTTEVAAWSPSSDIIAARGGDNRVQLWDVRTGRLIRTVGTLPAADRITQLLYSPDGRYLGAVAARGRVEIFDARSGAPLDTSAANGYLSADAGSKGFFVPSPGDPITDGLQGTWAPHGDVLALYGSDVPHLVMQYASTGNATRYRIPAPVSALAFAPTGFTALLLFGFATGNTGHPALVVDFPGGSSRPFAASMTQGWNGDEHRACWSPDGSQIATWNPVEAQDPVVRLFDARTGKEIYDQAPGVTTSAAACGATLAGPYLATGTYAGLTYLLRTTKGPNGTPQTDTVRTIGHTRFVDAVATTADGSYAATASDDGTVRVIDAVTGTQVSVARAGGPISQIGFSHDGGALFAVEKGGTIDVFDSGIGEAAVPLAAAATGFTHPVGFVAGGRWAYGFAESTKRDKYGYLVVTALRVLLWNAHTGALTAQYQLPRVPALPQPPAQPACDPYYPPCRPDGYAAELAAIRVSSDGRELAYAQPGAVVVRNLASGTSHTLSINASFVFFVGGTHEVVAVGPQQFASWDPDSGHRVTGTVAGFPLDAQLSGDGRRLAVATANGASVFDVATGRVLATMSVPKPTRRGVLATTQLRIATNHDGSEIALGDSVGTVRLWRTGQARPFAVRHLISAATSTANVQYPTAELRFVAGGTRLLAANYPQIQAGDTVPPGAALLIDAVTGKVVTVLASPGQYQPPWRPSLSVSPDGQFLLGGAEGFAPENQVPGRDAIYDLATSQKLVDLQGPLDSANVHGDSEFGTLSEWSPDGTRVLIGTGGIYACDACAAPSQLRQLGQLRQQWATPLTPGHDDPPSDNALF